MRTYLGKWYIWEYEAKMLITNKAANTVENIVLVRTFRPSPGAIVNAKSQHKGVT